MKVRALLHPSRVRTRALKAAWAKRKRAERRALGYCLNHDRPATHGVLCKPCREIHTAGNRNWK